MTESEASTILKAEIVHHPECSIFAEALGLAIQALEEVQQYRKIGTIEECEEARSKQMPKKVKEDGYFGFTDYSCPTCGYPAENRSTKYCKNCGQRLGQR